MSFYKFKTGLGEPFFLIAGPCVIESEAMAMQSAEALKNITDELGIPFIYKSSFDKANRTSSLSQRGPGRDEGLRILEKVRDALGCPILTDVHSVDDVKAASEVVDAIQTPAFLCRQTDLIVAAAQCGVAVNIKKGQFLSAPEMVHVVHKAREANSEASIAVCERGNSFGYNNLVVDMRNLEIMRETECPVVFDATHSVQLPGGANGKSGGQREFVPVLARAAVAVGVDGLFMESHPDPDKAWSDGPNAVPLSQMKNLLSQLMAIHSVVRA
ncbi:MAG: 3-deoxy-8-phosphooctulonate synthase [Arenicellales bacterium]